MLKKRGNIIIGIAGLVVLIGICVAVVIPFRDSPDSAGTDRVEEMASEPATTTGALKAVEVEPISTAGPAETSAPVDTLEPAAPPATTESTAPTAPNVPGPSVTPAPTAIVTDAPAPAEVVTELPAPSETPSYPSGGLGLSRVEWEKTHTQEDLDYAVTGVGYDGKYDVVFLPENIWMISRRWTVANAATVDAVEIESQGLIPADSELIRRYSPEQTPERVVLVYMSESLKGRFDPGLWSYTDPGTFIVSYTYVAGVGVLRMIVTIDDH